MLQCELKRKWTILSNYYFRINVINVDMLTFTFKRLLVCSWGLALYYFNEITMLLSWQSLFILGAIITGGISSPEIVATRGYFQLEAYYRFFHVFSIGDSSASG